MPPPAPFPGCYWVEPGPFLAGSYPAAFTPAETEARLRGLLAAGVTAFIDLTARGELPGYEAALRELGSTARRERHPIGDFGTPSREAMRATLDAIAAELAAGGTPYVHCRAGIGRTGTVVGCWLAEHGVPEGARGRPPETAAQRAYVEEWMSTRG